MLIMGLIHGIDHGLAGFFFQHIDVVGEPATLAEGHIGADHDAEPPDTLGDVPVNEAVLKLVRQIHGGGEVQPFRCVAMAEGHHLYDLLNVLFQETAGVELGLGHRANHIRHPFPDQLFPQMGPLRRFQIAVGVAGGEVAVIQQPYLHIQFLSGLQNESKILPPGIFAKILVGAAFGTKLPDAACLNGKDLFSDPLLRLSMEPQKGQDVTAVVTFQIFLQTDVHRASPFRMGR